MDAKVLERLRPADGSVHAAREALVEAQRQRVAATSRLDIGRQTRATALESGTNKQVEAAEAAIRDAEIDLERLEALVPRLHEGIQRAQQAETQEHVCDARQTAERQIAVVRDMLTDGTYAEAAATIVRICRADAELQRLMQTARQKAKDAGCDPPRFDMEGAILPLHGTFVCISTAVMLPALPGTPEEGTMLWGGSPASVVAAHRPLYASPYAPVPVV